MARFRRGMSLRPINSVKNIVDGTFLTVAAAVITTVTGAATVNTYTGAVAEVPIGAKVSSMYYFVQIQQQAVNSNVDFYIIKRPTGVVNPVPGATGGNVARKYILHEEKGIPGASNNGSPPLTFRGVVRIPRGRQRFAEGDFCQLVLRGAAAYDACVKIIYKFYQ